MAPWRSRLSRKKLPLLSVTLFALGVVAYHFIVVEVRHTLPHKMNWISSLDWKWSQPLDDDQLCHFSNPNPVDPSIWAYLEDVGDLRCKWQSPFTFIDNDGMLRFNLTAVTERGYTLSSLWCFYRTIQRKNGTDDEVELGTEQPFQGHEQISSVEYVSVFCKNWIGWKVYSTIHAHPRDLETSPRARTSNDRRISVLIFGIDSLSRLNAMRQLPKTYHYLTREMGAVVLEGLNKVGDNTYPNMVALLTGRRVYSDEIVYKPIGDYHDDWPIVWKNFSRAGYVTMYAEDLPEFNLFNYLASGFKESPTDHYLRPFWLAAEKSDAIKISSHLCFLERPKHVVHLDYVRRFLQKYHRVPYFALSFLTEISHDHLNLVGVSDNDMRAFLSSLYEGGLLNDTLVVFMGDHGNRYDSIRITPIGHLEENAPFCVIVVPPMLREKNPEAMSALRVNSRRLATMFDFYDTFIDLLRYGTTEGSVLGGNAQPVLFRGHSLFNEIPKNRTCISAGVAHRYCICEEEESIALAHPRIVKAARLLLGEINARTVKYRHLCSKLTLSATRSAVLLKSQLPPNRMCIRIVTEVTPGDGLFEGNVCFEDPVTAWVEPEISRINRYGGQDWCLNVNAGITDKTLRMYCYCK